jgi:UrcA family protein
MLSSATQAAEPSDSLPHEVVSFKDLNLKSTEGVTVLYQRIRSAAKEVCGNVDLRDLAAVRAAKDCVDKAESRAILAVDSPMLTNLSLAKTGKTEKQLIAQAR